MQINIVKNSVDRMPILFHMLLPTSCASKWYQWLRIWLSRNIRFVGVNVGMSARNRHFQTNYWCITLWKGAAEKRAQVILVGIKSDKNSQISLNHHKIRDVMEWVHTKAALEYVEDILKCGSW